MHDITVIAAAEADVEEDLFQDEEYDLQVGLIASVIIIGADVEVWLCGLTYYAFYYRMSHADESHY